MTGKPIKVLHFAHLQNIDLISALERKPCPLIRPKDHKEAATEAVTAYVMGSLSRWDDWYVYYAYRFKDIEYHFAWETGFDEIHRAFGGKAATWYDAFNYGRAFPVRVVPGSPANHFIADSAAEPMNAGVILVKIVKPGKR